MIRKVLQDQEAARTVPKRLPKVKDLVSPHFMSALTREEEMNGLVDQANAIVLEKIEQNEAFNEMKLDEAWIAGGEKGFGIGVKKAKTPSEHRGYIKGIISGWDDAETFKKPLRLYDTSASSTEPIASARTDVGLSAQLGNTKENRLWKRVGADRGDRAEYEKVTNAPFTLHEEMNRLSINQTKFANSRDVVTGGRLGRINKAGASRSRITPKTSREDVLQTAMGSNVNMPTFDRAKMPGREVKPLRPKNPLLDNVEHDEPVIQEYTSDDELADFMRELNEERPSVLHPDPDKPVVKTPQKTKQSESDNIASGSDEESRATRKPASQYHTPVKPRSTPKKQHKKGPKKGK